MVNAPLETPSTSASLSRRAAEASLSASSRSVAATRSISSRSSASSFTVPMVTTDDLQTASRYPLFKVIGTKASQGRGPKTHVRTLRSIPNSSLAAKEKCGQ